MEGSLSDTQKDFQTTAQDRRSWMTLTLCRLICIAFALAETWSQLRFVNEDGISYFDMSDALITHNWHLLVNPIWSPLYPLLIGVVTWLTRPPAQWEAPIAHAVNFVIFLGAMAAFEFLLRQVIKIIRQENIRLARTLVSSLPIWTCQLFGYSLFAWSTIGMMWAPRMVTPDLCVATFVYLDAGLLLSLRDTPNRLRICLWLGLSLGLGYWAKAILFPMAFVLILTALFVIGDWRKALRPLAVSFLIFIALAAPLLVAMSRRVGRPSYSEAGNMNYVWHVNHFDPYAASAAAAGPPTYLKHPMSILHRRPDVYGFREPTAFTYPPRQDMEYWSAGTPRVINREMQLRAVGENLRVLFTDVHIVPMWGLIAGGLILSFIGTSPLRRFSNVLGGWPLIISGLAGPALYLLISVEPRYVAPFLVLILLGLFPGVFVRNQDHSIKGLVNLTVALSATALILSALLVVYHAAGFPRQDKGDLWVSVGKSLNAAGVQPGEEVAIIGDSSDGCRWARVARVRIVAQVLRNDVPGFWHLDPSVQSEVYDAFVRAGAKAVVAEKTTPSGDTRDWQRLGNTDYYVYILSQKGSNLTQSYDR